MKNHALKWSIVVGGILGSMFVANGLLIHFALAQAADPVPNAYEKALRWDKDRAERVASARLGWQVFPTFAPAADGGRTLRLEVVDSGSRAISLDRADVTLMRPSDSAVKLEVSLAPEGDGLYSARVDLPTAGLWQIDVALERGAEQFRTTLRADVR